MLEDLYNLISRFSKPLDVHMEKNCSFTLPYIIHKYKLKMDLSSKCKTQNKKLVQENIRENFCGLGRRRNFSDRTQEM